MPGGGGGGLRLFLRGRRRRHADFPGAARRRPRRAGHAAGPDVRRRVQRGPVGPPRLHGDGRRATPTRSSASTRAASRAGSRRWARASGAGCRRAPMERFTAAGARRARGGGLDLPARRRAPGPSRRCSTSTAGRTSSSATRSTSATRCGPAPAGRWSSSIRRGAADTATPSPPRSAVTGAASTTRTRWRRSITAIERGWIRPDRLAVTGTSYGGFMTYTMLGRTDRFRCAIVENGVSNLYTQALTSDNGAEPDGSRAARRPGTRRWSTSRAHPSTTSARIRTPLLIQHAEGDGRVTIDQAEQMFTALRHLGREVVLVRYPARPALLLADGPSVQPRGADAPPAGLVPSVSRPRRVTSRTASSEGASRTHSPRAVGPGPSGDPRCVGRHPRGPTPQEPSRP